MGVRPLLVLKDPTTLQRTSSLICSAKALVKCREKASCCCVENGDASLSSTFKTFKSTAICIHKVDFDVNDLHKTILL